MKEPDKTEGPQPMPKDKDQRVADGLRLMKAFLRLSPAQQNELIQMVERPSLH